MPSHHQRRRRRSSGFDLERLYDDGGKGNLTRERACALRVWTVFGLVACFLLLLVFGAFVFGELSGELPVIQDNVLANPAYQTATRVEPSESALLGQLLGSRGLSALGLLVLVFLGIMMILTFYKRIVEPAVLRRRLDDMANISVSARPQERKDR